MSEMRVYDFTRRDRFPGVTGLVGALALSVGSVVLAFVLSPVWVLWLPVAVYWAVRSVRALSALGDRFTVTHDALVVKRDGGSIELPLGELVASIGMAGHPAAPVVHHGGTTLRLPCDPDLLRSVKDAGAFERPVPAAAAESTDDALRPEFSLDKPGETRETLAAGYISLATIGTLRTVFESDSDVLRPFLTLAVGLAVYACFVHIQALAFRKRVLRFDTGALEWRRPLRRTVRLPYERVRAIRFQDFGPGNDPSNERLEISGDDGAIRVDCRHPAARRVYETIKQRCPHVDAHVPVLSPPAAAPETEVVKGIETREILRPIVVAAGLVLAVAIVVGLMDVLGWRLGSAVSAVLGLLLISRLWYHRPHRTRRYVFTPEGIQLESRCGTDTIPRDHVLGIAGETGIILALRTRNGRTKVVRYHIPRCHPAMGHELSAMYSPNRRTNAFGELV